MPHHTHGRFLTPKQRVFIEEYQKDFNSTRAALAAGYSPKSAHSTASQLLATPLVRDAIERSVSNKVKRAEVRAEDVIQELRALALSDLTVLFDQDGTLKEPKDWPAGAARFVAGFEVFEVKDSTGKKGILKKVKLWDKNTALGNLARYFGLLVDKHEHTGAAGGPIQVNVEHSLDLSKLDDFELDILRGLIQKAQKNDLPNPRPD